MRVAPLAASILLVALTGCVSTPTTPASAPPLVDGRCDEYVALGAQPEGLPLGVELSIHQDTHSVWLCYTVPPNSYGTLDLEITAPGLTETLNLHVSAQLGEWPLAQPELAPDKPESDRWWNQRGWYANPAWLNGRDRSGEQPRIRFVDAPARELQLTKARFGRGAWQLRFHINAIRDSEGKFQRIDWPADGSTLELQAF